MIMSEGDQSFVEAVETDDILTSTTTRKNSWSIGTYVRIRPPLEKSKGFIQYRIEENTTTAGERRSILEIDIPADADPGLVHNHDDGILRYEFDASFDRNSRQEDVFDIVARDKILAALEGINCTIFAYGQTGSGKTHSMFGGDSYQQRGLIPRTIGLLFSELQSRKSKSNIFKMEISFTEIYKEVVYDLLDQSKRDQPIEHWTAAQVLESDNGLVLKNVNVFRVETEEEALNLFFMGNANRITESTAMNDISSRSHAIFTLVVRSECVKGDRTVLTSGKINLVDLAGSERMYKMVNSKVAVKEAKAINLSLHYLEQVIVSLREHKSSGTHGQEGIGSSGGPGRSPHVPYRNSVLTNMLRDSLGGNCRSSFLLTLSMERAHFEETVSTCRFGQRCGEIKVQVHANAEVGLPDQLRRLQARIKQLERQLSVSEEQRIQLTATLEQEREQWRLQSEPRTLYEEEKSMCKSCVGNLVAAAKESLQVGAAGASAVPAVGAPGASGAIGNASGEAASSSTAVSEVQRGVQEAEALIERSQEDLYGLVERMDKAVLIELSTALGALVQSMIIDRERAKLEEQQRQQRKAQAKLEKEAQAAARLREEEESRKLALEARAAAEAAAAEEAVAAAAVIAKAAAEAKAVAEAAAAAGQSEATTASGSGAALSGAGFGDSSVSSTSRSSPTDSLNEQRWPGGSGKAAGGSGAAGRIGGDRITPEDTQMLVAGTTFLKHTRLRGKQPRTVFLTPDFQYICWKKVGVPATQSPSKERLKNFSTCSCLPGANKSGSNAAMICLQGGRSSRSLTFEVIAHSPHGDTNAIAMRWSSVLTACISSSDGQT